VLHALRIDLCVNAEKGHLSFADALTACENALDALIQKAA
jgi:hypothetical protein